MSTEIDISDYEIQNDEIEFGDPKKLEKSTPPNRRCFVLREVGIHMLALKRGDIFRLEPIDDDDIRNTGRNEWSLVASDAQMLADGTAYVECDPIAFVVAECPAQLRFQEDFT